MLPCIHRKRCYRKTGLMMNEWSWRGFCNILLNFSHFFSEFLRVLLNLYNISFKLLHVLFCKIPSGLPQNFLHNLLKRGKNSIKICPNLPTQNFFRSSLSFFKIFCEISLNSCKIFIHITLHFYKYFTKLIKNFLGILFLPP